MQTYEVLGSARPDLGVGGIRRSVVMKGPELTIDGRTNLFEIFSETARRNPTRPCLGHRPSLDGELQPFVFETYDEVLDRATAFASGLDAMQLCAANEDGVRFLGFIGPNQPNWVVGELGAFAKKIVPVPLYETLGVDAVRHAVTQTGMDTIVCASAELERVLSQPEMLGLVRVVVLMDSDHLGDKRVEELVQVGKSCDLCVVTMEEVEAAGDADETPLAIVGGKDLAFLCYTSGTTGAQPKGAMISHENIISSLASLRNFGLDMTAEDVHLSYLPLAHVFERAMVFSMLYAGGRIGFLMADTKLILDAIQALRPTVFPTVPRLLNKMYDRIMAGVEQVSPVKQRVFQQALLAKLEGLKGVTARDKLAAAAERLATGAGSVSGLEARTLLDPARLLAAAEALKAHVTKQLLPEVSEAGGVQEWLYSGGLERASGQGSLKHALFDRIVFAPLKKRLGLDRCRLMVTGSASIAGSRLDFFRAAFGIEVLEGFGQTESSVLISTTLPGDYSTGHVGVPAPCNEVRLADVPEMGYLSTDTEHSDGSACLGRGEITFRGSNVFAGYYKEPAKTAEAIDADGFVRTGDIGLWTADGKLRIVDRKKNIFKLAQGEYIAPEKIEQVALRSPFVSQCFVYGDPLQSSLVAVVVPDLETLEARALKPSGPATTQELLESISAESVKAGLKGFERVRAIHVEADERAFTAACLTATLKLRRHAARDHYRAALDGLYASLEAR